ncbi:HAD domain-containing protein [Cupriavidus pauculus]|uniref:HAD domain-containing protein n=1 Tax=Cupriavidus pauculus TaxID=82633 RepID=UPI00204168BA|nr:HAD domain-containing protein [Cupriavidus pauculus]MCM3604091.1 HAD domain-containing protein [Cupriavidus pauculus]
MTPSSSRNLPFSYWRDATRYQQVRRWVRLHRLRRWVAIDDDAEGWDEADRGRLVQMNGETGLSDPAVLSRLQSVLAVRV